MQIDILVKDTKAYTYENHACERFREELEALNISSRKIVLSEGVLQDYLILLNEEPPDWMVSFDEIFFQQKPFCDIVQIPHFYWKNGMLGRSIYHFNSTYGKVGCIDRLLADHFSHPFVPHACSSKTHTPQPKRLFEVVIFQDLIDLQSKKKTWHSISEKGALALENALEAYKKKPYLHPALFGLNSEEMLESDFISEMEEYIKAERTLRLVESLQDVRIDIFGDHVGNNWLLRLKNKNVRLHGPLPYGEQIEVLKLAQVLVRDQPLFSDASDEWLLHAWSLGCFAFSNPNPYLVETFKELDCFYHSFEELNDKVKQALDSTSELSLYEGILKEHSWEKRTHQIVNILRNKNEN